MKLYSTMINEFISHTIIHVRAPSRAPTIDEIEFSLKKVNFLPFSSNLHLIVKVTSKCIQWSVHEWKYSQCEMISCWYQEICARALMRAKFWRHECILFEEVFIRVSLKRFLYNFLWLRGFYTIFSEEFLYDLIDLTMVELPIKYEVLVE